MKEERKELFLLYSFFLLSLCLQILLLLLFMGFSSKKGAKIISRFASRVYFFLIIFQIPLFRFPCKIGICSTPIEYTLSQLIGSEMLPHEVVKFLLYPGKLATAIFENGSIPPSYNDLLPKYRKFTDPNAGTQTFDLQHIEVLAGSYFCLAGAIIGMVIPGRISLLGTLLIVWGIAKEFIFGKHSVAGAEKDPSKVVVCIYWTMYIALFSAFFSVRGDVRKLIHICKVKSFLNLLKKYSRDKYK